MPKRFDLDRQIWQNNACWPGACFYADSDEGVFGSCLHTPKFRTAARDVEACSDGNSDVSVIRGRDPFSPKLLPFVYAETVFNATKFGMVACVVSAGL